MQQDDVADYGFRLSIAAQCVQFYRARPARVVSAAYLRKTDGKTVKIYTVHYIHSTIGNDQSNPSCPTRFPVELPILGLLCWTREYVGVKHIIERIVDAISDFEARWQVWICHGVPRPPHVCQGSVWRM